MVRLWVANTDLDWFDFLASQPGIDEVNFWQPSGTSNFGAIQPGELFLFRLKSPRNAIGGYGVFSHASRLPISLAWEAFGIKNGAVSYDEMRRRVGRLRDRSEPPAGDYVIGARIVVQPVFFPEHLWIPQPESWAHSIVVGKTYRTDDQEGLRLWESVIEAGQSLIGSTTGISELPQRRYGEPTLIIPRLGQGAFRVSVTDAYGRACAVSLGKVLPRWTRRTSSHIRSAGPMKSRTAFFCAATFTAYSMPVTSRSAKIFASWSVIESGPISIMEKSTDACTDSGSTFRPILSIGRIERLCDGTI
jgi:hypothetical protein